MKWSVLLLLASAALSAQQVRKDVELDGMGNAMPGPTITSRAGANANSQTELRQSVNGRMMPVQSTNERVISDDGRKRVVERVVKRYDPMGGTGMTEKVLIEQEKQGSDMVTRTSTYRSDLNRNLMLSERTMSESRQSGNTTVTNETVQKPNINGGVDTAERKTTAVTVQGKDESRSTVVYRKNENGQFYEAIRQAAETKQAPGVTTENESTYESYGGQFRLVGQKVKRTVKAGSGEQVEESLYKMNVPGVARSGADQSPQLVEQRMISRQVSANEVKETVDVRRTSLSSPDRLGAPVRERESVCTGTCKP